MEQGKNCYCGVQRGWSSAWSSKAKLDALLQIPAPVPLSPAQNNDDWWMDVDNNNDPFIVKEPPLVQSDQPQEPAQEATPTRVKITTSKQRILPNAANYCLYHKWMTIVPTLVDDYLHYTNATMGKEPGPGCEEIHRESCSCYNEKLKATTLTCL